jgi:hypothetical protein
MGTFGTEIAGSTDQELELFGDLRGTICIGCGEPVASVLEQLGSLRCHDCRDGENTDALGGGRSRR